MTELSWFEDYGYDMYKNYDMSLLGMDQAYLTTNILDTNNYYIYSRHKECLKCPYLPPKELKDDENRLFNNTFIMEKVPQYIYRIATTNKTSLKQDDKFIYEIKDNIGEFGVYELTLKNNNGELVVLKQPVSIAFPVLTVFLLYLAIIAAIFCAAFVWKKTVNKNKKGEEKPKEKTSKPRVKSLDTFRGISIILMIFVNYGAGGYEVLDHAAWNGLHAADLVFPWFMWIMGVCIPISLSSSFKRKTPNSEICINVLKRSIKLFCLGIFLGGGNALDYLRIFGVLQRFSIAYLVVTITCVFLMDRNFDESQGFWGKISDILVVKWCWIFNAAILLIHCLLTFLLADEGCPKGYLGPGGLHDNQQYYNCTGGAAGYIDKTILGKHIYHFPTIKEIYKSQSFDPEGILGCLTSIVHVFIGVQAGVTLLVYKEHSPRLIRWLSWSVVTGIIGGVLCGFSKDDGVIPVNKNLWSISFVMATTCFAFFLLSVCYVLVDVKKWWSGKPFLIAGMNAILLYIGHSMTYGNFPVRWLVNYDEEHRTHFIALFENLWGVGFWILVAYYWYKINYFFTI